MREFAFFDTNILIYALEAGDPRSPIAQQLLSQGGIVSVQSLNEFVAVARRKLRSPWPKIAESLTAIQTLCPSPTPITVATHVKGVQIAERYGYRIYDSLLIASALEAGCKVLYSEDLRNGQVIEGLRIENPFPSVN